MGVCLAVITGPSGGRLCILRRGLEGVSTTICGLSSGLSQIAPIDLSGPRGQRAVTLLRRREVAVCSVVMSYTSVVRATMAVPIPSILAARRSRIRGKRVLLPTLVVVCITD